MKLTGKFLTAFISIGLLPFAAISVISVNQSTAALEEQAFNQLNAVREIKKVQLLDYMHTLREELSLMRVNKGLVAALPKYNASYATPDSTQITDKYNELSQEYDPFFRSFLTHYGWYDFFMINAQGKIIYTATREPDLGQFITQTSINQSGLGVLFAKLRNQPGSEQVLTSDISPYAPSNNAPAGFMMTAMPLGIEGGPYFIALQLPLDQINKVMTTRAGMGETGETYLIGPDYLMRSDSYLDPTYHSVAASFQNPQKGAVKTASAAAVQDGKSGSAIISDYNGNLVLSSYTPVDIGGITWGLIAEIDEAEAFADVVALERNMAILALVFLVAIIAVALVITRSITNPIKAMVAYIQVLAQGKLNQKLEIKSQDELGEVATALNRMTADLNQVLKDIQHHSGRLASSSTELSAVSTQLANAATEMNSQATTVAGSTDQITANLDSMASGSQELSANSQTVAATATQMSQNMQFMQSAVHQLADALKSMAESSSDAAEVSQLADQRMKDTVGVMKRLHGAAAEIGEVTSLIKEIAQQTNLLALNANIEAASAGDAGKGFAVVANEIKELANQSQRAAEDITRKIGGIQSSTEDAVTNIDQMTAIITNINQANRSINQSADQQQKTASEVSTNVKEATTGVDEVSRLIEEMASTTRELALNADQLAAGAREISRNINGINTATNDTANGANQIKSEAGELSQMANHLQVAANRFELN